MPQTNHERSMEEAIVSALDCFRACQKCAAACLMEKNSEELNECIRLDLDCADICDLSAGLMSRDSDFHAQACQLCVDICEACALECDKHSHMDHCRECADACRLCAEACRSMLSAMA